MDDAAHRQLLADAAGTLQPIPENMARHAAGQVGGALFGLSSFQPLWNLVMAQEPDLLDQEHGNDPDPRTAMAGVPDDLRVTIRRSRTGQDGGTIASSKGSGCG